MTESVGSNGQTHQAVGALEMASRLAASLLRMPVAIVARRTSGGLWQNSGVGLPEGFEARPLPLAEASLAAMRPLWQSWEPGQGPLPACCFCAAVPFQTATVQGALFILGPQPHTLSDQDIVSLERLSETVGDAFLARPSTSPPPEFVFHLDLGGNLIEIDNELERAGLARDQALGTHLLDLVVPEARGDALDWLFSALSGDLHDVDLPLATPHGQILLCCRPRLQLNSGRPESLVIACRDVTGAAALRESRSRAERELGAKARELAVFSRHLRELHRLSLTRHEHAGSLYRDYLSTGCAIFRQPAGRVLNPDNQVLGRFPENFPHNFAAALFADLEVGGQHLGTLEFGSDTLAVVKPSAHDHDVLELMAQGLGHAIYTRRLEDERGQLTNYLSHQLRHDSLTGLPNRAGLMERLDRFIASAETNRDVRFALLFLDLDHFKQINDTLGHNAGDELLREAATRLAEHMGEGDFAARIGGDEFTLLLAGRLTEEEVAARIQPLLASLREPYVIEDRELFVTASIGICLYPEHGSDPRALLQHADSAMYRVKEHGKNDFGFYRRELYTRALNRLDLETQLRRAIENSELDMRFQPILDTDRKLEGLEVLLSWHNTRFGNVGPTQFIPIAEESGMIISIGAWVLRQACLQNMQWTAAGYIPARLAVNVSALQFSRPDFVDLVAGVLSETGMPPQCLELELTESIILRDLKESARRMDHLQDLGISLVIDDFGTGYSSLSYLSHLPVDALKIDRSFLTELTTSANSLPLIQTIVVLAHNMGLSVVAEGVETEQQLQMLRSIGCDRVQGHLFGGSLRAGDVPALLRTAARRPKGNVL